MGDGHCRAKTHFQFQFGFPGRNHSLEQHRSSRPCRMREDTGLPAIGRFDRKWAGAIFQQIPQREWGDAFCACIRDDYFHSPRKPLGGKQLCFHFDAGKRLRCRSSSGRLKCWIAPCLPVVVATLGNGVRVFPDGLPHQALVHDHIGKAAGAVPHMRSHHLTAPVGRLTDESARRLHPLRPCRQAADVQAAFVALVGQPFERATVVVVAPASKEILQIDRKNAWRAGHLCLAQPIFRQLEKWQRFGVRFQPAVGGQSIERAPRAFAPVVQANERVAQLHARHHHRIGPRAGVLGLAEILFRNEIRREWRSVVRDRPSAIFDDGRGAEPEDVSDAEMSAGGNKPIAGRVGIHRHHRAQAQPGKALLSDPQQPHAFRLGILPPVRISAGGIQIDRINIRGDQSTALLQFLQRAVVLRRLLETEVAIADQSQVEQVVQLGGKPVSRLAELTVDVAVGFHSARQSMTAPRYWEWFLTRSA